MCTWMCMGKNFPISPWTKIAWPAARPHHGLSGPEPPIMAGAGAMRAAGLLPLLVACCIGTATAQECATSNAYDAAATAGSCEHIIASGMSSRRRDCHLTDTPSPPMY